MKEVAKITEIYEAVPAGEIRARLHVIHHAMLHAENKVTIRRTGVKLLERMLALERKLQKLERQTRRPKQNRLNS